MRVVTAAVITVALAAAGGCSKDEGSAGGTGSASTTGLEGAPATPGPPEAASGVPGDLDAILARYSSPEQMRAKIKADARFSKFDCARSSRADAFGGRFIQCSVIAEQTGEASEFVRLETYSDAAVGDKVDDGLSKQGWVVYPGDNAAVAVAGDPQLMRDAFSALDR